MGPEGERREAREVEHTPVAYFVVLAPSLRVSGATARAVGHAEGPPAACRSRADCLPRSLEVRPARESLPERARELHPGGSGATDRGLDGQPVAASSPLR